LPHRIWITDIRVTGTRATDNLRRVGGLSDNRLTYNLGICRRIGSNYRHLASSHDKTIGRRTHIIEGIAGDQRERILTLRGRQYGNVVRIDDGSAGDLIFIVLRKGGYNNVVVLLDSS